MKDPKRVQEEAIIIAAAAKMMKRKEIAQILWTACAKYMTVQNEENWDELRSFGILPMIKEIAERDGVTHIAERFKEFDGIEEMLKKVKHN